MSWFIVHSLDFSIRRRLLLFVLLFTTQLSMLRTGGENYAPLRVYCAAFLVIVIHKVWRQTRKPLLTSVLAILAVGIALLVSPEQAIGVVLGMFAYLLILMSLAKSHFTWMAFLLYILGSGICFAYAVRNGLFFSFRDFASGGYSYPVVPSPTTVVALLAYVVAACSLVNALHKRRVESVITPLVLTGFAMIPTVLGRCDSLHICAAMPAFVVGAASISAMPSLRRYWVPSAFIFLFVVPSFLRLPDRMLNRIPGLRSEETTDQLASQSTRQPTTGSDAIAASDLPCDQKYFAPSFEPWPGATFLPECLDTGYYRWVEMVITPRSIDRKLQELKDRPTQKLLLNNQPLEAEFGVQQADMAGLRFEAVAPWVPRVRNPPVTFNPIINYIRLHYVPGPIVAGGRLRIWLPIERSNLTLQ